MGKQKDQEGSGKGIYRMFSIIMSLTDFERVALERDRLAIDRERVRSQAIRELLLTYSSVKSGKLVTTAFHPR